MRRADSQAYQVRLLQPQDMQSLREELQKEEDRPQVHLQELLGEHHQEEHVQKRELDLIAASQNSVFSFLIQTQRRR
jgi:hypothetical protein